MAAIAIFEEPEAKVDEVVAVENSDGQQADVEDAFGLDGDSDNPATTAEEVLVESKDLHAALVDQGFALTIEDVADWDDQKRRDAGDWIEASNEWMMADRHGKAEGDPPARPEWLVEVDRLARERSTGATPSATETPAATPTEAAPVESSVPVAPPATTATARPAAPPPAASMSDPDFEIALQIVSADREIIRYTMIEAELKDRLKDVKKSLEGAVSERMELQRAQASRERDIARGQGMLPFGKSGMATGGFSDGPVGVKTADGQTQQFSSITAAADFIAGDAKEKFAEEAGMNESAGVADDSDETSAASGTTEPLPAAAADPGKTTPISSLDITKGQVEKLEEQGINTVRGLEEFMSAGKLQYVKGFGDKAIDRISDALFAWRQTNPIPTPAGEA